jgi:aspartate aminotransferase-like enzyme
MDNYSDLIWLPAGDEEKKSFFNNLARFHQHILSRNFLPTFYLLGVVAVVEVVAEHLKAATVLSRVEAARMTALALRSWSTKAGLDFFPASFSSPDVNVGNFFSFVADCRHQKKPVQ